MKSFVTWIYGLALAIGDKVAGAKLVRVDRYRVVLDNGGKLEQVSIEDAPTPAVASRHSSAGIRASSTPSALMQPTVGS